MTITGIFQSDDIIRAIKIGISNICIINQKGNKKMTKDSSMMLIVVILLSLALQVNAGEIEPRAYVNTPVGVNFLVAGYAYSDGGLATVINSPVDNSDLKMDTGFLAYAHTLNLGGNSGKFDIILPYSHLSGSATWLGEEKKRNVTGLIDPRVRISVNLYGAPAQSLKEFTGLVLTSPTQS